jgi:tetratricopeptide (TPR) repeat protein
VLLTGDPGIGKSRLLRYLQRSIVSLGGEVLTARAFGAEMRRPYGIWADLLGSLPDEAISVAKWPQLQPLIVDVGHAPSPTDGDRVQLFAAMVSLLSELSSRAPVAVLIDDLQWVDESSLSLLHYVIRTFDGSSRVVIAATARTGELPDNAPAERLIRSLARERRLGEIPLDALDLDATLALATAVAPDCDVAPVIAASEGNPLFTIELARALAAGESAIPDNIENVLAELLSRPDAPARALLPWAAALGREFDIAVLARCLNLSPSEWHNALEELERRGIIRCIGEARYDFSHDLIRASAYRRISQPRRYLLHGQIAQSIAAALDANEAAPSVASELTRHAELGGNHALAARGCVLAGEHCMRVFANDEAIGFAERGLRHLADLRSGADWARLRITLLKVQILASPGNRLQRWPNLVRELLDAIAAAEEAGLKADLATGYYLLSVLHQDEGDTAEAQAMTLRAAEISRNSGTSTAAAQLANTARCLIELEQDIGRSRSLLAEASAMSDRHEFKTIEVLWSEALLRRWDGILDAAPPLMEEALQVARAREDRWRECKCLAWLAVINLERGDPEATLACCDELGSLAARMGESGELPFVRALEALAHLALQPAGAADGLASAVEQLRAFDSKAHLAYILNATAEIAFAAGDLIQAYGLAQEALAAAETTRRVCEIVTSRALLARALWAQGDAAGARSWLDPILQRFDDCDAFSARARSAGLLAAEALGLRIPTVDQTMV